MVCLWSWAVLLASTGIAFSQEPDLSGTWLLDTIQLKDGQTLEGLMLTDDAPGDFEFAEVRRPAGKPMYVVIRPIERRDILRIDPLSAEDRSATRQRLRNFVRRAAIEARQIDQVQLKPFEQSEKEGWQFRGEWFSLDSSASESTTRQAVVRMEQMFAAYRQMLPPLQTPRERLKIKLFGSTAEYSQFLRGFGLEIANPAFFAADFNLVAAGSDVDAFRKQVETAVEQHAAQRTAMESELTQLPARLAALLDQLRKAGIPDADRKAIVAAEQRTWQDRKQQLLVSIAQAERRNAFKLDQVTQEMYARLYHEAFHAYLENYVYPHQEFDVPRWLNEGLALTFEAAQLDGNALRVDAPNQRLLLPLQQALREGSSVRLAEVLTARAEDFLPDHLSADRQAARLYQVSWGLAYYLVFQQPVLGSSQFEDFVAPSASKLPSIERFEKLVGKPLGQFEAEWREAILNMRP